MVSELAKALDRAAQLPDREQQVPASILNEELDDERGWQRRFDESPQVFEMLVRESKAQYVAGQCIEEI